MFSIASLNILVHFILYQIWYIFFWVLYNPFLLDFFFNFILQYFINRDFINLLGYGFE
jgi:hypothetical protein